MNAFKTASYVGFIIALFGIAVAVYGFRFLLERNDLQKNGVKVKGTVIQINQNGPMYRMPVVEYMTQDKKKVRFESRLQINHLMFTYVVGQQVDVLYHKDNPLNLGKEKKAEIDAFWEQNMPQIFLGSFGLFLILFGLFIRWLFLRKARKYAAA